MLHVKSRRPALGIGAGGNDPLPTPSEAMHEPFVAFPSWLMRIRCPAGAADRADRVRQCRCPDAAHGQRYDPTAGCFRRI